MHQSTILNLALYLYEFRKEVFIWGSHTRQYVVYDREIA